MTDAARTQAAPGPVALGQEARRLLGAGRFREAQACAEALLAQRSGTEADDFVLRAICRRALRQDESALADLEAALQLDPWHVTANRLMLRLADASGRRAAAGRLVGPVPDDACREALAALRDLGERGACWLEADGDAIGGWAAGEAPGAALPRLVSDRGPLRLEARPEASALPFPHLLRLHARWPEGAEGLVAAPAGIPVFPDRLLRPRPIERLAPGSGGRGGVAVIVPVHGDADATAACLASIAGQGAHGRPLRVIVVEDASPDAAVRRLVDRQAGAGTECLRLPVNLGFAAAVNSGLRRLRPDEDALVLNADTILPPGAVARLAAALHREPRIGSVTPLSNNGEYTSVPVPFRANPLPGPEALAALDALAAARHAGVTIDLPNGIGFCLMLRRAMLEETGLFSTAFGRGYGEDIELCLRGAAAGWRHVCAADVYVGHHGSVSFGAGKRALVVRNLRRVNELYPDYAARSAAFVKADPLRPLRATFGA